MKKRIIAALAALAIMAAAAYFMTKKPHTVADFTMYPCRFDQATRITIDSDINHLVFEQSLPGSWFIAAPKKEPMAIEPHTELMRFLSAKMLVDEQRTVSPQERKALSAEMPTKLQFFNGSDLLCSFELGRSLKMPSVDAERRWVFPDGSDKAYRAFVHLMDFGRFFEQPAGGWRERSVLRVPSSTFEKISIWTQNESFELDKKGKKSDKNPQGWQVIQAQRDGHSLNTDSFDIDPIRAATLIDLSTPLLVDDLADDIPEEEKNNIQYGGRLTITANGKAHVFEIGSEADLTKHPEWAYLGEGARYMRSQETGSLTVVSAQRLMGLFPSLDDMRSKYVWQIDTSRLSAVDVKVGQNCLRYAPSSKENWSASPCEWLPDNALADEKPAVIDSHTLGIFAKTLSLLQAIRYAPAEELRNHGADMLHPEAIMTVYLNNSTVPAWELRVSAVQPSRYRYAQVRDLRGAHPEDRPYFVITDELAHIILGDLRQPF